MGEPPDILDEAFQRANAAGDKPLIRPPEIAEKIEFVCRCGQNQAGTRLLLSCALAKTHKPSLDIRKPYTKIGDDDAYSGRTYDERYIPPFAAKYDLPCNPTTAFLTPALRNREVVLTPDVNLVGRPPQLYENVLHIFSAVEEGAVTSSDVLAETIRCLLAVKRENAQRMASLLAELKVSGPTALSSEGIVKLVEQHLACRRSSRLPVLIVAAAYRTAAERLGERILSLLPHNAADEQTGALGDVEITLAGDDNVVTSYEMKMKAVTKEDVDRAMAKIRQGGHAIDNYVFITTERFNEEVKEYADSIYDLTGGVEVAILDCVGFLRHFLHLFHRARTTFLEEYQQLVIAEPESAVSQPLKEAFLALRRAAESGE